MTKVLLTIFVFACAAPALAGDPCPIEYPIVDLGTPKWLKPTEVLQKLSSKAPWVGVNYKDRKKHPQLTKIHPGSPAERAGLQVDDKILSANGKRISNKRALENVIDRLAPGDKLKLTMARGTGTVTLDVQLGWRDPIAVGLDREADKLDCGYGTYTVNRTLSTNRALERAIFTKGRGFRCKDAHKRLSKVGFSRGDIAVVRGSRRVLLASVGWKTVCVRAADYDGKKASSKRLKKLLQKVTDPYVSDRFENP